MATCLYTGRVEHIRYRPRLHRFRYRMAMLYLDLDEPEALAGFSALTGRWFSPLRFRGRDHGGGQADLKSFVQELIEERTGAVHQGPVHLLTGFGFMAYRFNPVSFYYCHAPDGERLQFVVAEVTNTPWHERHYYVLDVRHQHGAQVQYRHPKAFHVSPFMGMDNEYQWRIGMPGKDLSVDIGVNHGSERLFSAVLWLNRKPLTRRNLWLSLAWMPFNSLKVIVAIHWQALRLWLKKAPFYPHPGSTVSSGDKL